MTQVWSLKSKYLTFSKKRLLVICIINTISSLPEDGHLAATISGLHRRPVSSVMIDRQRQQLLLIHSWHEWPLVDLQAKSSDLSSFPRTLHYLRLNPNLIFWRMWRSQGPDVRSADGLHIRRASGVALRASSKELTPHWSTAPLFLQCTKDLLPRGQPLSWWYSMDRWVIDFWCKRLVWIYKVLHKTAYPRRSGCDVREDMQIMHKDPLDYQQMYVNHIFENLSPINFKTA